MGSVTPLKLPIIDFCRGNLKPGSKEWDLVCSEVGEALAEYGCFEAVYDNVTQELCNAVFGVVEELFNLPMETKHQNITPEKPYFGYLRNLSLHPLYEGMGIYDVLLSQQVQSFINLMWPQGNKPSFCEILHSYSMRLSELDQMVKRMVFQCLGVEKYFKTHGEPTNYLCRVIKYKAPNTKETILGAAPHTDFTFLTILHQNQVHGLEVQAKCGQWIPFTPAASSFIVMSGDAFLAWSNGRLHSPRHRVMMSGNKTRYSIGLFSYSKEIVECPEELVDEKHPLLFKPFDNIGLLDFAFTDDGRKAESAIEAYCGL